MAMEILGPNVAEQRKKNAPRTGVMLTTVIRIVDQLVVRLEHIHSLWIVHRDIKPKKLLCTLDDSTIKIIDFDISKLFSHGRPSKDEPLKERRVIIRSLHWASLNSHNGIGIFKVEVPHEGEDEDDDDNGSEGLGEDSYFAVDLDMWEYQGERYKNLTLLAEQEVDLQL
ncbi:hypothetical protein ARMSODRAFT_1022457 [Armillaria solidipes]|uniref:Protein kinase domain-containing protein n=1 Tax=Armillaria solidipes TaxID=1076256 RepID=A0A2H3B356_9AGAR|nr:hypothetical protein ARMSODRAFT_1022457 [Armillaria solidipes]